MLLSKISSRRTGWKTSSSLLLSSPASFQQQQHRHAETWAAAMAALNFHDVALTVCKPLIEVQKATDMPWAAVICLTTVGARASLLPLVYLQVKESTKLTKVVPELNFLYQLLKQRLQRLDEKTKTSTTTTTATATATTHTEGIDSTAATTATTPLQERLQIYRVFAKGVRAGLNVHEVHLKRLLLLPIANAAVFCTFVLSIREIILNESAHAEADIIMIPEKSGLLWFSNITEQDPLMLLPVFALVGTYVSLQISFGNNNMNRVGVLNTVKDALQSMLILSLPAVMFLPSGVFCYWIPSTLLMMLQTTLLRHPPFMTAIGLPPVLHNNSTTNQQTQQQPSQQQQRQQAKEDEERDPLPPPS